MRDILVSEAKVLLDVDDSKHNLLSLLASGVIDDFMNYCNRNEVPDRAKNLLLNMLLIRYNKMGVEGLASQSFSGISESYIDGYPDEIRKQLNNYRKLMVL